MARLIVDDRVSPAHILLSPPQLRHLGVGPHRRLACSLKARQQPPSSLPLSVVLHPVRELRPGVHRLVEAEVDLQALSRDELRKLFASWLASQATPAVDPEHGTAPGWPSEQPQKSEAEAEPGNEGPDGTGDPGSASHGGSVEGPGVALQSGSALSVQSADGMRKSSFFLELTWQLAAPKDSHLMLQSAQSFLESGVPVELGPGVELPAAPRAAKSGWHEQAPQSLVASHPAANDESVSSGAGAPLHVSGQDLCHLVYSSGLMGVCSQPFFFGGPVTKCHHAQCVARHVPLPA